VTFSSWHRFTGGADGGHPIGPLVQDADGNLYGVAQSGGDRACPEEFEQFPHEGCGVAFKLAKSGELTVLHTFRGGKKDGAVPQAGLLLDASGNLFGTTLTGGPNKFGTVFKIANDATYTVLHKFASRTVHFRSRACLVMSRAGSTEPRSRMA